MKKLSKKRILIALIISFTALYLLGGLGDIQANVAKFPFSIYIYLAVHIFFPLTLTFFLYKLLGALKNKRKVVLLFIASFLIVPLVYYTINPPFVFQYNPPLSQLYILFGDPLRDVYGINWYWMDWGVWMTCVALYLFALYAYLLSLLIDRYLFRIKKSTKER